MTEHCEVCHSEGDGAWCPEHVGCPACTEELNREKDEVKRP